MKVFPLTPDEKVEARRMLSKGTSSEAVCEWIGCTPAQLEALSPDAPVPEGDARTKVRHLYVEQGLTLRATGARLNLSHERVRQLLISSGIAPRSRMGR